MNCHAGTIKFDASGDGVGVLHGNITRPASYVFLACSIGLSSGCALFNRPDVTLDPVGPPPVLVEPGHPPDGSLAVYSAWDSGSPADQSDVAVNHHSDYKIYSSDGKLFKTVNNFAGTFVEDPATVSLLPGHYTVVARAAALGFATVPVVIEAGKTTSVYLDGSEFQPAGKNSPADFVRLPGGTAVGWRANEKVEVK